MDGPTVRESLVEYGRGVAGGLLFALPLLYTMEVWQTGVLASPARILAGLGGTFALLIGYNRFSGMREDATFVEVLIDSVEEMGLGVAIAVLLLWLTGRLGEGDAGPALLGKVAVCSMMCAIGVSVGTAQLGTDNPNKGREVGLGGGMAIAVCGAVLVAGNVAPTEEVVLIAYEAKPPFLLGLLALAFGASAIVAGEFRGKRPFGTPFAVPPRLFATTVSVAIGILSSAALLLFFGSLHGNAPSVMVAQVVVLTVPASLGASAGRLLLQT